MAPKISNENSLGKGFAMNFRKKNEIIRPNRQKTAPAITQFCPYIAG
jgi:hypothetical protein